MATNYKPGQHIWVVLVPQAFDNMTVSLNMNTGVPLARPPEEPYSYLPVFESYETALSWNNGIAVSIREVIVGGEPC